jgi:hypothetical protein
MLSEIRSIFVYAIRQIRVPDSSAIDSRHIKRQYGTGGRTKVEITKALAALQPLYGKDNVEIITTDGRRVRGTVRSMKTTQALTTPSVKILCADGQVVKIPFPTIAEIKDHNLAE